MDAENTSGAATVDVAAALAKAGADACITFRTMTAHTRASSAIASALVDTTTPEPFAFQTCDDPAVVTDPEDEEEQEEAARRSRQEDARGRIPRR